MHAQHSDNTSNDNYANDMNMTIFSTGDDDLMTHTHTHHLRGPLPSLVRALRATGKAEFGSIGRST